MKKFLIWFLLFAALVALIWLVNAGIIDWQPLTVAVAALLAPLKFIAGLFGSDEEKIRERHRRKREEEAAFQEAVEAEVARREQRVRDLQSQAGGLDEELEQLARRRAAVAAEIRDESDEALLERINRLTGAEG